MNIFVRALAGASLVLALGSCGSNSGGAGSSRDSVAPEDPPTTSTQPAEDSVTAVMLRRSGGMKGQEVRRSFVVGQAPPAGFTAAEQDTAIELAQALVDSAITLDELPQNTCCDRYTYVVVVGMADGSTTTYTALDGEPQPPAFSALLSQLS